MRIELVDVALGFDGKPLLFEGANLRVESGDFVVIEGPSGCGKSSLLRLLNRLGEPTRGELRADGKPFRDWPVTRLRRRIGYLQQTPVMVPGSVAANLHLPFDFAENGREAATDETLRDWLDRLLLKDVGLDDDARQLSVGQQQRLALIRLLLIEPDVLLGDEPVAALDATSRDVVERCLEERNREAGMTVVLVTHQPFDFRQVTPRRFQLSRKQGLTAVDQAPSSTSKPPEDTP